MLNKGKGGGKQNLLTTFEPCEIILKICYIFHNSKEGMETITIAIAESAMIVASLQSLVSHRRMRTTIGI